MLAVNKDRVNDLLMGLGEFGKTDQGVTLLAYIDEDRAAQNWLLEKVADLKLQVREDVVGNVFLRRVGEDDSLPEKEKKKDLMPVSEHLRDELIV